MSLTESTSRAGFQIALEATGNFLGFEGEIGFQLPRSMFGGVARNAGLAVADPCSLVCCAVAVEMALRMTPLEDVSETQLRFPIRLRPLETLLLSDAFSL